jgi:hypothetical protein
MKIEKDGIIEFKAYCPKHYYYIAKHPKFPQYLTFNQTFKGVPSHIRERIMCKDPELEKLPPEERERRYINLPPEHRAKIDDLAIREYLESGERWKPSKNTYQSKAIRSKEHEIYVKDLTKEISDTDDKRYYLPDGIHSLA